KPMPKTTSKQKTTLPESSVAITNAEVLPKTGEVSSVAISTLGSGMLFASLSLINKRRKNDED
ncbi:TPA: LPXTG cell wall anchor domain-containing protein, partial [Streptococcus suis]